MNMYTKVVDFRGYCVTIALLLHIYWYSERVIETIS